MIMEYTQYETQRSEVRFIICYQYTFKGLVGRRGGGGLKGLEEV